MLVRDVMTRNVITVTPRTSIGDAQRIMKERKFRRLPVVDRGKLVGLVTKTRLESVKPKTSAPLLWQLTYVISHTTVGDVMRKRVVRVKPTDTVEYAVAKAQSAKVGTLVVLEGDKIVGICTTNDFFYKIVNPTLGLGEPGVRLIVINIDSGKAVERIINRVNRLGVEIRVLWVITSLSFLDKKEVNIHLDTEDADKVAAVMAAIEKMGYSVRQRAR